MLFIWEVLPKKLALTFSNLIWARIFFFLILLWSFNKILIRLLKIFEGTYGCNYGCPDLPGRSGPLITLSWVLGSARRRRQRKTPQSQIPHFMIHSFHRTWEVKYSWHWCWTLLWWLSVNEQVSALLPVLLKCFDTCAAESRFAITLIHRCPFVSDLKVCRTSAMDRFNRHFESNES